MRQHHLLPGNGCLVHVQVFAYGIAGYTPMWEQALKMDEEDVIIDALAKADLPAQEIVDGMSDPTVKQALIDATESTVGRGTFGAPTLFVGDEIFFGKDKLRDAIELAQA